MSKIVVGLPFDAAQVIKPHRNQNTKLRPAYEVGKRGLDIALVLLLAPFALLVIGTLALIIRSDGGRAFYSHPRIGKNGRIFKLWKLRSMVPNADLVLREHLQASEAARLEWERTQKLANDPRIT